MDCFQVKDGRNAMTLSIGDGANDVAMIQEANVGCGLMGLEGSQAAMSADYAFGQFRFLTKLLIVHGRWSYLRIADMHANFFYKVRTHLIMYSSLLLIVDRTWFGQLRSSGTRYTTISMARIFSTTPTSFWSTSPSRHCLSY